MDTAAPTPYGWVITTETQFDLDTILSFRGQLASLSKFFESHATVRAAEEAEVLQPVHAPTAA